MMMNGKFIKEATSSARSTTVATVIDSKRAAALGQTHRGLVPGHPVAQTTARRDAAPAALRGRRARTNKPCAIFWTLLNSTEFILNH